MFRFFESLLRPTDSVPDAAPPALDVPPAQGDRAALLSAIEGSVLAAAEMSVIYSR